MVKVEAPRPMPNGSHRTWNRLGQVALWAVAILVLVAATLGLIQA